MVIEPYFSYWKAPGRSTSANVAVSVSHRSTTTRSFRDARATYVVIASPSLTAMFSAIIMAAFITLSKRTPCHQVFSV